MDKLNFPPLWQHHEAGVLLWVYPIAQLCQHAQHTLSPASIEAITSPYKSKRRQCEKLAAYILLPYLLPAKTTLHYEPTGRPYLVGSSQHISITHNEEWIGVGICDTPIGIDIEKDTPQITAVASKFFTAQEMQYAHQEATPLAILWSAKEALYKWANQPGLSPLHDITINNISQHTHGRLILEATINTQTLHLHSLHLGQQVYLSWCINEQG